MSLVVRFHVYCTGLLLFYPSLTLNQIFWVSLIGMPISSLSNNLQWVLMPDCADYGKYKTGISCNALLSSVNELVNKICGATAGLL